MSNSEERPPIPAMPPRDEKQHPYADVFATFENGGQEGEESNLEMVELGPAWMTKRGNLSLELKVEPLRWRDPRCPRRLLLVVRRG
jgi:hypothetical protein